MRSVDKVLFLLYVTVVVLAIGGWVANVVKIITTGFVISQWGGLEVARCIGVFIAPLGSILGFF